jgi:hypothetical protein
MDSSKMIGNFPTDYNFNRLFLNSTGSSVTSCRFSQIIVAAPFVIEWVQQELLQRSVELKPVVLINQETFLRFFTCRSLAGIFVPASLNDNVEDVAAGRSMIEYNIFHNQM